VRQPVQRVPSASLRTGSDVGDDVAVAVALRRQVPNHVLDVGLGVARREVGLLHPSQVVVDEAGGVRVCIGDAGEVVLVVVGVLGQVLGRVGDRDQPVSVVVSIRRLLPILVRYRSTTASSRPPSYFELSVIGFLIL